ncbi:MAG: NAD-dependent epimerase/dehydratase family protein, partial [Chloroflexi bacterium]|nr:NAD-dependent epimerase/dehydratase family protein [Chloroflexota bacterium]
MKVLVLGGSRFIGLHLVRLLHDGGHQVTVLNRGQTQANLPDNVVRLIADRTDTEQVKAALKDDSYDVAFDISAYTTSTLKPVIEILEGRVGRFVFCSTTSVYGPNDTIPIEEDFPLHRSPDASQYARDKIECEDFLVEAFNQRGFPMTILRPPYVYGPDNYLKAREFSYFARLKQGRKIIIPGDGLTPVHPVHVDDLADAFAAVPGKSQTLGPTYTI